MHYATENRSEVIRFWHHVPKISPDRQKQEAQPYQKPPANLFRQPAASNSSKPG